LWSDRYLIIYRMSREDSAGVTPGETMNVNSFEDLEKFDQSVSWITRDAFLAEARDRIANGQEVFTEAADDYLAHYGWLVPRQEKGYFPLVEQHYEYPPGSAVMYNGFCHPRARGRGLHQKSLGARAKAAFADPETNYLYAAIEIDNWASRHCSEKLGLRPHEVLFRRCRAGRVTKGSLPPTFVADFDARKGR